MPAQRTRLCLGAILVTSTLARLALGFVYFGFHTGDDVEILREGFRRALGWPYEPWAIRNLLASDLLTAPAITLASALGVGSTRTLVWLASVPIVLLATLNVWLVNRLAARWLGSERAGLLAAGLYAFHWIPLGYGSMVYPRTASTACILLAVLVVWDRRGGPVWRSLAAGGLLAVAWAFRYSEAIFLLPLLGLVGWQETEPRDRLLGCGAVLAGFAAVSLLTVGLEDWLTWGRPFASLAAFARYTLIEGKSSSLVAAQHGYWYFKRIPKWLPLTLLPFLWQSRKVRGAPAVAAFIVLPILMLSAIHQKQFRYLQGVMPFLILLAVAGAWSFWTGGRRKLVMVLAGLAFVIGLTGLPFLAKKSMAAVRAAEDLGATRPARVCLSQAWAYGGTLYLGRDVEIRDLPYPLSGEALEGVVEECPVVAFYEEDYQRGPGLRELLSRRGFEAAGEYRWGGSKAVVVFLSP
ncbi:MAG: hypothetical protein ACJ75H_02565 [Thermoanaerobaculia bacterium]